MSVRKAPAKTAWRVTINTFDPVGVEGERASDAAETAVKRWVEAGNDAEAITLLIVRKVRVR